MSRKERTLVYASLLTLSCGLAWSVAARSVGADAPKDLRLRNLRVESVVLVDSKGEAKSEWRADEMRGLVKFGGPTTNLEGKSYKVSHGERTAGVLGVNAKTGEPYLIFYDTSSTSRAPTLLGPGLLRLLVPGETAIIELEATPRYEGDRDLATARIRVWGELIVRTGIVASSPSVKVKGGEITIKGKDRVRKLTAGGEEVEERGKK